MPSDSPTIPFIAATNKNTDDKNSILNATVVANYGDPGLQEDYFADILSQYVICCIESSARTLTNDRWPKMLVIVERPKELWISYQSNIFVNNPNVQSRVDANNNVNTGPAASYTSNTIAPISNLYNLGDTIQIRKKKNVDGSSVSNQSLLFTSACPASIYGPQTQYYGSWYNQGGGNPYIQANNSSSALSLKTITPVSTYPSNNVAANSNQNLYNVMINKIQYEAFALNKYPPYNDVMVSLFQGQSDYNYYYQGNGGYAFINNYFLYMTTCVYEDLNLNAKQRIPNVNCLPLVVCTPQTWTVPSVRSPSTINYSPTVISQG